MRILLISTVVALTSTASFAAPVSYEKAGGGTPAVNGQTYVIGETHIKATVPDVYPSDPSLTGGGSLGYNHFLPKATD